MCSGAGNGLSSDILSIGTCVNVIILDYKLKDVNIHVRAAVGGEQR